MSPARKQSPNSDVAILERLLRPQDTHLSRDAAQALLALSFDPADLQRMQHLAASAQAGDLTEEDREEADNYERVGHLLGLLRSKARRALRATSAPAE